MSFDFLNYDVNWRQFWSAANILEHLIAELIECLSVLDDEHAVTFRLVYFVVHYNLCDIINW